MVSLRKLMPVVALLAGTYVTGSVSRAEDMDMKKVMEEIRAIKAQNAELQKQVATMKTGEGKKASAEVAVDKALRTHCTEDGFFHDADLHPRKIKIGGLVDFSYQYNINNPGERFNTLRSFDAAQSNDFALNMANIYFDGTAKCRGEAGFMIDLGFGRDVSSNNAGINTGLGYDNVLQAYINYIAPIGKGLELTAGKFYTPHGFEVSKGDNWNITRGLNFAWTQALSHTGGQLGYQVLDSWKVKAGVVNSFYNRTAQDNNNAKMFYGSSTWSPIKQLTWSITGMIGQEETRQSDVAELNNNGAGFSTFAANTGYPATTALFGNAPYSPAANGLYGDVAPPNYPGPNGTNHTLRGEQGRNLVTINSVLTYDPFETLHFGFEFNWQMKEGFNYKKDDLITDPGSTFNLNGTGTFASNTSLTSAAALMASGNPVGAAPFDTQATTVGNLTNAQIRALYQAYNNADRGNAYTWGAAAYAKWDFQKNWYVAFRGEYLNDQDNLAFRNDLGVAAQNNYLAAAKQTLFPTVFQGNTPVTAAQGYARLDPNQYNRMIEKLDHRNNTVWSATGTVGWNITKSLKWKAEYRHDQADKDVFYRGGGHKVSTLPSQLAPGQAPGVGTGGPGAALSPYTLGYVPNTSSSQDTVSMQLQYSF